MGRCKNCLYWVTQDDKRGWCSCDRVGRATEEQIDLDDTLTVEGYGDLITILTGRDFSCCHWRKNIDTIA